MTGDSVPRGHSREDALRTRCRAQLQTPSQYLETDTSLNEERNISKKRKSAILNEKMNQTKRSIKYYEGKTWKAGAWVQPTK